MQYIIRAIEPLEGTDLMLQRRRAQRLTPQLTGGPGTLSQALGLTIQWTNQNFLAPDSPVWIENCEDPFIKKNILATKRIGVEYAGVCADWEWRFLLQ